MTGLADALVRGVGHFFSQPTWKGDGMQKLIAATAALSLGWVAAPANADTAKTPPGNPCAKNNGNPCNGNNGNAGAQGNAGHDKVKIDKKPPLMGIGMPSVSGRGAYVSQIGDSNQANIVQTAANAYAKVEQDGDANDSDIAQTGTGSAYIESSQEGDGNFARLQQSGSGANVAYVTQSGNGNWLESNQVALGAVHNGAILTQTGDNNDMSLYQEGSDNLAALTQEGDDNGMSAVQLGDGNRLSWTQQGSGLTDLQITQTGGGQTGGQLSITQTNVGPGR